MKTTMKTRNRNALTLLFGALLLSQTALASPVFMEHKGVKGDGQTTQTTTTDQTIQPDDACDKPARAANGKPAPVVTYGPVITIKPKGMHEQKGRAPAQPGDTASSPAAQRDKCFTNH